MPYNDFVLDERELTHVFFFFQAEDGIRDRTVTGVQTCALPICAPAPMQSQLMSAAVEIPVRDQPIDVAMGCRNTVSEAIAPNPTQVTTIPTPTMIQPYSSLDA